MKKLALMIAAAGMVGFAGTAFADKGGQPNENAYTQTGQGEPNGRKGICVPPGSLFKTTAKADGPNNDPFGNGLPPGQEVQVQCEPGNPS